ncbi:MAG: hypothetical protein R3F60_31415 [bacterium]
MLHVLREEPEIEATAGRLVNQLLRLPTEQGMLPAMSIAASCWPRRPMATRHAAVLSLLNRAGTRGVEAALRVMAYDPAEDWQQTFATLHTILSMPADIDPAIVKAWLSILFQAAHQTKRADHVDIGRAVLERLPPLELVVPARLNPLDEVLSPLASGCCPPRFKM